MARVQIYEAVQEVDGDAVTGATVNVYAARTVNPSVVYLAETGGTTVANPLTTVAGSIAGWLEEGEYDLVVSGAGITTHTRRFNAAVGGSPGLAPDSVGTTELAADSVGTSEIQTGAVGALEIATDAVDSAEIKALAVGNAELAVGAALANLAADSINGATYIAPDTITSNEIANDGVGSAEIQNGSVTVNELASDAVTTVKVLNANVTDAKLASPNNSVFKSLFFANGGLHTDAANDTYLLGTNDGTKGMIGGSTATFNAASGLPFPLIWLDDADFTVAGLTTRLRVRVVVTTNATAPAVTLTTGLYPLTAGGGADAATLTCGVVVSGSTVAHASPAANSLVVGVSSEFTVPTDGAYGFAVLNGGTLANNAAVTLQAQLQVRHT